VTVVLDGHPQSAVDPDRPDVLVFEYVALLALALDACSAEPGPARLAVTHVGGGGLTLPRWVQHSRPGSPQVVLEPDAALTEQVRQALPLPRGHRIRVRPTDGRSGVAALADASADAVVLDAYAGGRVPAELGTAEFLADCARVLRPTGVLLANVADEPGLRYAARVAAGARAALGHPAYLAPQEVLKGRRFGNGVLVAQRTPVDTDELARRARRLPFPAGVLGDAEVRRRVPGARPFTAADAEPSPEPPAPGRWRLR
jgi:spermidine synthase